MTASAYSESVSDYSAFDFRALWKGREKVTEVERSILETVLGPLDRRRILEVGSGFGRLLPTLASLGKEVVATDFDVRSLGGLTALPGAEGALRVAANVYHLPFVSGAFTTATMVRVYHHLSDPTAALREISRVLQPGSRFVVSYNPKPSIGTFVNDVQRAIHPSASVPFRSITFARGPTVLDPDPFPVYVAGRREFEATVRSSGLAPGPEVVSGLEEYYLMRHIPAGWFVRVGTAFGNAPAFPMRFALVSRSGHSAEPPPPMERILACPRCTTAQPEWGRDGDLSCGTCSFTGRREGGVLDLRFLPEGTRRWEAPA